jgi:hypothetical protein
MLGLDQSNAETGESCVINALFLFVYGLFFKDCSADVRPRGRRNPPVVQPTALPSPPSSPSVPISGPAELQSPVTPQDTPQARSNQAHRDALADVEGSSSDFDKKRKEFIDNFNAKYWNNPEDDIASTNHDPVRNKALVVR